MSGLRFFHAVCLACLSMMGLSGVTIFILSMLLFDPRPYDFAIWDILVVLIAVLTPVALAQ